MGTYGSKIKCHEFIGGGASGEVFKATWQTDNGKVEAAAKKIRFQGEIPEQVKREIGYLKKLDHKNIIKYYDTIIEEEHVVIVTEYATKGSLDNFLKTQTKLPEDLLHTWIFYLASGIEYLHRMKIGHRDLKSPNCVITADNVLKICDFGIARDLSSTTTTHMKGSYKWLAPEVIKVQKLSHKADIFAFAIIVWEMVMCEEPYKGMMSGFIMFNVCNKSLRPQIPANCPPFLKDLMEQCWHADPHMRPTSKEVLQMIATEYKDDIRDKESLLPYLAETDGLEWRVQHVINGGEIQFVSNDHLAICRDNSVEVHRMTKEATHLLYRLRSDDWGQSGYPCGVAVSDSMPDDILVICRKSQYVYQFPCHESGEYIVKKYQIHDGKVEPCCIATNDKKAVIGLYHREELVVCSMPGFTNQKRVALSLRPCDLCITSDFFAVMGMRGGIVIKSLGSIDEDVCTIQPPDGRECRAVSYRNDARQLYVACYQWNDMKDAVYKYTWDGKGTPQYVNAGCVIDNLDVTRFRGLSILNGLLAVSPLVGDTQLYRLQYKD